MPTYKPPKRTKNQKSRSLKSAKPKKVEENPQAFKHGINEALLKRMAEALKTVYPDFKSSSFLKTSQDLPPLELKARVQRVRDALKQHLPPAFPKAVAILLKSLKSDTLRGFDLWPYTEFIQTYGLEHFDISMEALSILTSKFTSEFAVRPFLVQYPEATYAKLLAWADHPDHHIRRWTSEGSRPRLPWGLKLQKAIQNPRDGLQILEKLKWDPELYVRKSVANHLNDVAKDHPDLVVQTLKRWQQECPPEAEAWFHWIQRHALRTLIKKGYKPALKLMGAGDRALVKCHGFRISQNVYKTSETLYAEFNLTSTAKKPQKIIVDYIIHFMTARGQPSAKVFKLKSCELAPGATLHFTKKHSLKPITTRRYYPGQHRLEIQVNGEVVAGLDWKFKV